MTLAGYLILWPIVFFGRCSCGGGGGNVCIEYISIMLEYIFVIVLKQRKFEMNKLLVIMMMMKI